MSRIAGKLIAVEGIDGSGKSTQIRRIAEWLELQGAREVCLTAEPTNGPLGRRIREAVHRLSPEEERYLFAEDRRVHVQECIRPVIERGGFVVTDRYFYSSVAYQGTRRDAFERDPSDGELERLQDEIYAQNRAFAPEADILVYIRLDAGTAIERMKRGRDRLDPFEDVRTLEDVANAFERVATNHPCAVIVDGTRTPDVVTGQIIAGLETILL